MEQDKPCHSGYLLLPPQGKLLIKKSWHQKFCLLFKASKFGIQRLEIYDTVDDAAVAKGSVLRIITLEDCIKITQKSQTCFVIITKTAAHEFATVTQDQLKEWSIALQSVAFRDDMSKLTSMEEDNDLYCYSGEGVYNVRLHASEASVRCNLEPKNYILILTDSAIELHSSEDNVLLFTWPYRFVRRYGYKEGKFTFEAGRKCESGEGTFHLEHSNQQEIFRRVGLKMKSMKKMMLESQTSPTLDSCGSQFQAALSMEARSRTPIPPSPNTSTVLNDLVELQQFSIKSLSFTDLAEKRALPNPLLKPIPSKPPRKAFMNNNSGSLENYEPIDRYDKVEYRKEAWRTLGTDDVKHTENMNNNKEDNLEDCPNWGQGKDANPVSEPKPPKTTKIITHISTLPLEDESYDRLSFFGSCNKLNVTMPGYKQISPAPGQAVQNHAPSFNDYDEVQPAMEGIRIADDSHLGYALIRKTLKDQQQVDHQFHNDDPYAIISKPKRV